MRRWIKYGLFHFYLLQSCTKINCVLNVVHPPQYMRILLQFIVSKKTHESLYSCKHNNISS
uniref:Uncharacterized protein n=1 Tax=Arundo donax TaxID=35708 RepID=A0A0A9E459_ARUDO